MDIITILLSIIGTITGLGAAYFTYRQIKIARQSNIIQSGQRSKFPFDILTINDLNQPKILQKLLLTNADLAFVPRLSNTDYEQLMKKWQDMLNGDKSRILITGNTGTGKTRESIEIIKKLAESLPQGKSITILMPRPDMDVPLETPDDLPLENLVLFINDLHVKYSDGTNVRNSQLDGIETDSYHIRLKRVISFFDELTKGYGQFRVVATTRSEPDLWNRISPQDPLWQSFNIINLPPLLSIQAKNFVQIVANKFDVEVSNSAKNIIAENNDGTYSGIIVYLTAEKLAGNSLVSEEIAKKNFTGIYRDIWKNRVYIPFIKNHPARESIIKVMSILYQANFPLYKEIVTSLASLVWTAKLPRLYKRYEINKALKTLSLWINDDGILLNCPEFFLEGQDLHSSLIKKITSELIYIGNQRKWKRILFNVLFNYGVFLTDKYFTEQALRIFSSLSRSNPGSAEIAEEYSYILFWEGYFEKAQFEAEKAILLNPSSPKNYLIRADSMESQGKLNCNSSYIAAIRLGEDSDHYLSWAIFNYCNFLQIIGREKEAVEFLTKITELIEGYLSAYSSLALLLIKQGNSEEAQKLVEKVKSLLETPTIWSATGYKIAANLFHKLGKTENAVSLFDKAITLGQQDVLSLYNAYLDRSLCYLHLKQDKKAILDLQKSVTLSSKLLKRCKKNYEAKFSLAFAYALLGYERKSIQHLKKARQMCPTTFVLQDWILQIQESPLGDREKNRYLSILNYSSNFKNMIQGFQSISKSLAAVTKENRRVHIDKIVQLTQIRESAIKMQKSLQSHEMEITEGNVKIIFLGDQTIKSVTIDDTEQEFLTEALNKAIKESQREAAIKLQEMSKDLMQLLSGLRK